MTDAVMSNNSVSYKCIHILPCATYYKDSVYSYAEIY